MNTYTLDTLVWYTGQREESSFGLYYYGARWYDPALGRFVQADSIVPGGVQGLDRYAYVNNNPLRYTDPSGHTYCDFGKCQKINPVPQPIQPIKQSTPQIVDLRRKTQTPTLYPSMTPTTTQTPMYRYEPEATSTPTSQSSSIPLPHVYVDWSQVDYLNLVADGSGIIADGLTIAAGGFPPLEPVAVAAQEINEPIELAGLSSSIIETIQLKPSGIQSLYLYTFQNMVKTGARSERLIPVFGAIGNFVSLIFDLKPQITFR